MEFSLASFDQIRPSAPVTWVRAECRTNRWIIENQQILRSAGHLARCEPDGGGSWWSPVLWPEIETLVRGGEPAICLNADNAALVYEYSFN